MKDDSKKEQNEQCTIPVVIGRVYGQTISGTLLKHKVLRIKKLGIISFTAL